MRLAAPKFSRILVLGLTLSASAWAAPSSSRVPVAQKAAAPVEELSAADMQCNRGKDDAANCNKQSDAFARSAQAYSLLAFYMQKESLFAHAVMGNPAEKAAMQKAVTTCLENPNAAACDDNAKVRMLRAMLQYNLGRDVKSMILQNATNQENMKSLSPGNLYQGKMVKSLRANQTFTHSFKLQPKDFATTLRWDRNQLEDVNKLGENFRNEYEKFIDTYSSTVSNDVLKKDRWHYASAKAPGRPGQDANSVWELDPATNSPKLVHDRQIWDLETQNRDVVRETVGRFKKSLTNPEIREAKAEKPDPKNPGAKPQGKHLEGGNFDESLHFNEMGLGMPTAVYNEKTGKSSEDPSVVNANVVARLNKAVDDSAKAKAAEGKNVTDTRINVERFEAYLDDIWPKTGYKYRIPSSEK